jgi:hypothetical protein
LGLVIDESLLILDFRLVIEELAALHAQRTRTNQQSAIANQQRFNNQKSPIMKQ